MIRWDDRNSRWRWEFDRLVEDGNGGRPRIRRSRLLPKGISREQAEAIGMKMDADLYTKSRLVAQSSDWEAYVRGMLDDRASWLHQQVIQTRRRAKQSGRAGELSANDVAGLLLRSRGRCEVTGLQFQTGKPERARAKPFFHSIDRIDCDRGYESWNCRVVCYCVNVALSNWGEAVFSAMATGYVVNRYCAVGIFAANGLGGNPPTGPAHTSMAAGAVSLVSP